MAAVGDAELGLDIQRRWRAAAIVSLLVQVAMLVGCNSRGREFIRCSSTGAELPVIDVFELSLNDGTVRSILAPPVRQGQLTATGSTYEMLFEPRSGDHRLHVKMNRFTGKGERILGEDAVAAGQHLHSLHWTIECAPHEVSPSDQWLLEHSAR